MVEASTSNGANRLKAYSIAIHPQIMPMFVSNVIYIFEINIRASVVLGFVGAGGIGAPLIFALQTRQWSKVGIILLGIIVMVTVIDFLSGINSSINSSGRSFISGDGNNNGYTLINFIVLYFIGAFIRKNEVHLSLIKSFFAYLFTTLVLLQPVRRMESAPTQPAVKKKAWTAAMNAASFMNARKVFTPSEKIQML